jgi:hypothetical protein
MMASGSRAQRTDTDENIDLAEKTQCLHLIQESAQQRQIIAILRLNELRARGDFLRQALRPPIVRQGRGIFSSAEKYARRNADLAPALKLVFIALGARDSEQRYAVQIKHRLGLRMIAGLHAVASQAEHIADSHRGAA